MNKISVAVVDDNEKIVETICNELERDEEINIVGKAKNGEEAFDIIKKTNPDVVVLDLIMPKMDGLSLMNKIHKDGSIIKLPFFIITSAISNETVIQDAFGYGAGYYMLKPFETEMIVERVKTAKSYNKRLPDNKKFVAAYEDKKKFMDRNIESDVTNIIHDVVFRGTLGEGDQTFPAFQRVPVAGRTYRTCYRRRISGENTADAECICEVPGGGSGYPRDQGTEDREGEIRRCNCNLYGRSTDA